MTTTPSLVAMALSATQNNNQQTKGANKRGDGVEAMETAMTMVTAMAMATAMANGNGNGNCDGDGDGDGDGNGDNNGDGNGNCDGKGNGDGNTTINKCQKSGHFLGMKGLTLFSVFISILI